jgi:hypothetical protein
MAFSSCETFLLTELTARRYRSCLKVNHGHFVVFTVDAHLPELKLVGRFELRGLAGGENPVDIACRRPYPGFVLMSETDDAGLIGQDSQHVPVILHFEAGVAERFNEMRRPVRAT